MATADPREQKALLDRLVQQAQTDPKFKAELKDDPVRALKKAGLSDEAIAEVLRDEGVDPASTKLKTKPGKGGEAQKSCWFTCMTTSGCSLTISTA